ncbi:MAG: Ig-like domain-containing protein, partial [Roseibium sp.]
GVSDGIADPVAATAVMDITPVNDAPEAVIAPAIDTPVFRIGDEILVNTATEGSQLGQQITALSTGGFVVTWQDGSQGDGGAAGDTSSTAVKAQVFSADGIKVGPEFLVNTATNNSQFNPEITALSTGGFVVTWQDGSEGIGGTTGDTSGFAVKAQVFSADGSKVGTELLVNTATEEDQRLPEITALSTGGFVVTWEDWSQGVGGATGDASDLAIKAQVFSADGTAVGPELLVNTATASIQYNPEITALSTGGFVVTWEDFSQGVGGATGDMSFSAVKAQVFSANGTKVGPELLVNTATNNSQFNPEITALSTGGFVVTWQDGSEGVGGTTGDMSSSAVKAQVFSADGTAVGPELLVNTATASFQQRPEITALSTGGFVVTWRDYSQGVGGATGDASHYAVKAQVFSADGTAVGPELLVNTATNNSQKNPEITALSTGGFVVTWSDSSQGVGGATGDTSEVAIKAQVFSADGTAVGPELLVNTATTSFQYNPDITALENGGFVVTWVDGSQGDGGAAGDTSSSAIKAQVFGFGAVEQTDFVLKGIGLSVSDVDADGGIETITLAVDEGTLTAAVGDSGVTIVSGNGTGSLEISGTIAQLNALLGSGGTSTLVYFNDSDNPSPSTTLSLTIDDGGNTGAGGPQTAIATATLNIIPVNDAPVAIDDIGTAVEAGGVANGTPGSDAIGNVLANDTDIDSNPANFVVTEVRTGASEGAGTAGALGVALLGTYGTLTLAADGSYVYAVDNGDAAVQALNFTGANTTLTDTFNYTMSDGSFSDTAVLTVTVNGANDAPTAEPLSLSVKVGGSVDGMLIANDVDGDDDGTTLTYSLVSSPDRGEVSGDLVTTNGSGFTYIAPRRGGGQNVTFTYAVTDSHGVVSATQTVTIAVQEPLPPTAADDAFDVNSGTQLSGNLLADNGNGVDFDTNGDALTVTAGTFATTQMGTVTVQANGDFTYDPPSWLVGVDSFVYSVSDVDGTSTANVVFNVVSGGGDAGGGEGEGEAEAEAEAEGSKKGSAEGSKKTPVESGKKALAAEGEQAPAEKSEKAPAEGSGDTHYGGTGDHVLTGGTGPDIFVFKSGDTGHDTITDFSAGEGLDDVLQFETALFADVDAVLAAATEDGTNTIITIDADTSVTLENVSVIDLNKDDFQFV